MKTKWMFPLALGLPLAALASLEQKAPPAPPADANKPVLVWDVAPGTRAGLPRNFRTTDDLVKAANGPGAPSVAGLARLRASGSAEFTAENLKTVLAKLPAPVTIFDLRQEDHGFINGEAVSWYATDNWANVGKDAKTIAASEKGRLGACAVGSDVAISDDRGVKGEGKASVEHVAVQSAQTERKLVKDAGARYVRIPVADHCRPTDEAVDQFIFAVRQLPADGWAHFHCRAGKGRTTTFLALYDMLRNAREVSLRDILDRQALIVGEHLLQLDAASGAEAWKAGASADRAAFVRAFYDYARANPNGKPQLWSEWLKTQP